MEGTHNSRANFTTESKHSGDTVGDTVGDTLGDPDSSDNYDPYTSEYWDMERQWLEEQWLNHDPFDDWLNEEDRMTEARVMRDLQRIKAPQAPNDNTIYECPNFGTHTSPKSFGRCAYSCYYLKNPDDSPLATIELPCMELDATVDNESGKLKLVSKPEYSLAFEISMHEAKEYVEHKLFKIEWEHLDANCRVLCTICRDGSLNAVKKYIELHNINLKAAMQYPLMAAIKKNEVQTVEYLLDLSCKVSLNDLPHPIHCLGKDESTTVFRFLADKCEVDKSTLLLMAAQKNDLESFKYIWSLRKYEDKDIAPCFNCVTKYVNIEVIKYMIDKCFPDYIVAMISAIVENTNESNERFMNLACCFIEKFKLYSNGFLHAACIGKNTDIIKFTLTMGENLDLTSVYCISAAFMSGDINSVRFFIEKGANLSLLDFNLVVSAILSGSLPMVRYVVEDLKLRLRSGTEHIALEAAALHGNVELIQYVSGLKGVE